MSDTDVLNLVTELKTIPAIAARLGWKRHQVRFAMGRLETAGLVEVEIPDRGHIPTVWKLSSSSAAKKQS